MPLLDVPLHTLDVEGRGIVVRTGDRAVLVQSHQSTDGGTP